MNIAVHVVEVKIHPPASALPTALDLKNTVSKLDASILKVFVKKVLMSVTGGPITTTIIIVHRMNMVLITRLIRLNILWKVLMIFMR